MSGIVTGLRLENAKVAFVVRSFSLIKLWNPCIYSHPLPLIRLINGCHANDSLSKTCREKLKLLQIFKLVYGRHDMAPRTV